MKIINFSNWSELLMIMIQVASYTNQFFVQSILFPMPSIAFLILLIFMNIVAVRSFLKANSIHTPCKKTTHFSDDIVRVSYCKLCETYIKGRDHHCSLIGRCVELANYRYFLSYVLYSYVLSVLLALRLVWEWKMFFRFWVRGDVFFFLLMWFGLASAIYFAFFTGTLFNDSVRLILSGVYKVDEIKKIKVPKYTHRNILYKIANPRNWLSLCKFCFLYREIIQRKLENYDW